MGPVSIYWMYMLIAYGSSNRPEVKGQKAVVKYGGKNFLFSKLFFCSSHFDNFYCSITVIIEVYP